MRKLWIHIGTPKTGSTALQWYASENRAYLKSKGIDFMARNRRIAFNDLSVSLKSGRSERSIAICENVREMIAASDAHTFVMSSEMFTRIDPVLLRDELAFEEEFDTRIIGYFRRQDRFLESKYKQKLKGGRLEPEFASYVKTHGIGDGNYLDLVDNWQNAWPESKFTFRRFETDRILKNNVINDFMALIGLDIEVDGKEPANGPANPTPSIDMLDLTRLVAQVPGLHPRTVLRRTPLSDLPRFSGRVMDHQEARDLLGQFQEQNEVLRARFFPEDAALFQTDDLDGPTPKIATSSFTDHQRALILEVLKSVAAEAAESKA